MTASGGLGPDSAVARALPGFRVREEQREMAASVEEALASGHHLVVEAGTGVGKTFAYLVPVLLGLKNGTGPVIVATRTIALQEQLVKKDIPFLIGALGLERLSIALVKGRGNYVCRRRLELARSEGPTLFAKTSERDELERISAWAGKSRDGSLADLAFRPQPQVWEAVRAEQGNCLHRRCPHFAPCAYQRSRQEMFGADLLGANHAIVFADLALREGGARFLPDATAIILDEAHEMEEGATAHFGVSVSALAVTRLIARLSGTRKKGGLLAKVDGAGPIRERCEEVRKQAALLFSGIDRLRGECPERRLREPGEFADPLTHPLSLLLADLRKKHGEIKDPGLALEWKTRCDRLDAIGSSIGLVHGLIDPDLVYWIERSGHGRSVLRAAPVEVAPMLRRTLFKRVRSVVMTSATLQVGKSFEHFERRVGLDEPEEQALGSPFDFERQCRLLIYPRLPDPRDARFDAEVIKRVRRLVSETAGGAFILFTSYRALKTTHDALAEELSSSGLRVLRQGSDLRQQDIVDEFREHRNCVLFATDTFWQGIDVQGDHLRLVVMTRLPFPVPDHPLRQAREERLEAEGGDAFRDLSLPQAVLKLRQGFGRLIRTSEDQGAVAILDPRIVTKRYGRVFLNSLPRCAVEERD
ncbi:MAG: ATP-dependent DNA helicase [Planctomycetota bacterium]|nr:ATP-dependent DNA helicase [Planctomycetota bacterium]